MASAIFVTSALGIFSHMFAIVFMKLIFVARKALFAYFMSSAVGMFVLIIGGEFSLWNSLYRASSASVDFLLYPPTAM